MVPSPTSNHQSVVRNILLLLWEYVKKNNLGKVFDAPLDVIFTQTDVVQPDILYISNSRRSIIEERGIIGPPDLVVEVISPSTRYMDANLKKSLYERHGVREYLLVYPQEQKVIQYALEEGFFKSKGTFSDPDKIPLKILELELALEDVFDV